MFMDVVTDFGGGYTPTDADNLERGPVRDPRRPPVLAQHPGREGGRRHRQRHRPGDRPRRWASSSATARSTRAWRSRWASRRSTRATSSAPTACSAIAARLVEQTTLSDASPTTPGRVLVDGEPAPQSRRQVARPGRGRRSSTDILAGNTEPAEEPVLGRVRDHGRRTSDGPATLKTGTNNDAARPQRLRLHRGARRRAEREDGEYALAVGAWNGNSDNSLVSTPSDAAVLDRRHDLRLAGVPGGGDQGLGDQRVRRAQRPASAPGWTRGRGSRRPATTPSRSCSCRARCRRACPCEARCGEAVLDDRRVRGRARDVDGGQPWLAHPGATRPGRPRRPRGHGDRLLLQPPVQPVRAVVGTARAAARAVAGRASGPSSSRIDPCASPAASLDPSARTGRRARRRASPAARPTEAPTEPPTEAPTEPPTRREPTPEPHARAVRSRGRSRRPRRSLTPVLGQPRWCAASQHFSGDSGLSSAPAATGSRDRPSEPSSTCSVPERGDARVGSRPGPPQPASTGLEGPPPAGSSSATFAGPLRLHRHRRRRPDRHDAVPGRRRRARLHRLVHADGRVPSAMRVDLKADGVPDGWTARFRGGGLTVDGAYVDPGKPARRRRSTSRSPIGDDVRQHASAVTATGGGLTDVLPLSIRVGDAAAGDVDADLRLPRAQRGPSGTTFTFNVTLHNDTAAETTFTMDATRAPTAGRSRPSPPGRRRRRASPSRPAPPARSP